jgi:hypothetical protein
MEDSVNSFPLSFSSLLRLFIHDEVVSSFETERPIT